jgi:hypothetical protein
LSWNCLAVTSFVGAQGRGQETAACSPVYNYLENPPQLFAIICGPAPPGAVKLQTY